MPPEAIAEIRAAFAGHSDASIVVHPGLVHGYSHEGPAFDATAAQLGLDATRDLLADLVRARVPAITGSRDRAIRRAPFS